MTKGESDLFRNDIDSGISIVDLQNKLYRHFKF